MQRFVDALLAFPGIVLALFLVTAISPSTGSVIAAIAISFIPSCARTMGAQVLTIKADAVHGGRPGPWAVRICE